MMNDISQLTEYAKSVMLARFCGLRFLSVTGYGNERIGWQVTSSGQYIDGIWSGKNLYDPSNMALARLVMIWAWENNMATQQMLIDFVLTGPAPALDAVLELAIEAGTVTAVTPSEETR